MTFRSLVNRGGNPTNTITMIVSIIERFNNFDYSGESHLLGEALLEWREDRHRLLIECENLSIDILRSLFSSLEKETEARVCFVELSSLVLSDDDPLKPFADLSDKWVSENIPTVQKLIIKPLARRLAYAAANEAYIGVRATLQKSVDACPPLIKDMV
jgi:hypothetical protein